MTPTQRKARPAGRAHALDPEDNSSGSARAIAKRNLWISVPALFLAFAIWQVWSVVAVQPAGLGFPTRPTSCSGWPRRRALGRHAAHLLFLHGAAVRRAPLDGLSTASLLIPAIGIGIAVQDNTTGYHHADAGAAVRPGRRQLQLQHGQHQLLLPKERKGSALGVNAGLGNLGVSVVQFLSPLVMTLGIFGIFGGDAQTIVKNGQTSRSGRRTPPSSGCRGSPSLLAAWFGMNDIADAKASFAARPSSSAQAQLADVLAVPGHLRLVHRLCRRLPLLIKASSRREPAGLRLAGPAGGRVRPSAAGWPTSSAAAWSRSGTSSSWRGRAGRAVLPAQGPAYAGQFAGFFVMFLVLFPPASATARPSA
jgi:NNP family nitrate/nitrite transporter-like MFS transporter